jgi:hypothetical protein
LQTPLLTTLDCPSRAQRTYDDGSSLSVPQRPHDDRAYDDGSSLSAPTVPAQPHDEGYARWV